MALERKYFLKKSHRPTKRSVSMPVRKMSLKLISFIWAWNAFENGAEMTWDSLIFKTPQHQRLNCYNHDESHQSYYILKQIIIMRDRYGNHYIKFSLESTMHSHFPCVYSKIMKSVVYIITAPKGETPSHLLSGTFSPVDCQSRKTPRFSSPMNACFFLSISLFALYL